MMYGIVDNDGVITAPVSMRSNYDAFAKRL